jgi:hypothetical protein
LTLQAEDIRTAIWVACNVQDRTDEEQAALLRLAEYADSIFGPSLITPDPVATRDGVLIAVEPFEHTLVDEVTQSRWQATRGDVGESA